MTVNVTTKPMNICAKGTVVVKSLPSLAWQRLASESITDCWPEESTYSFYNCLSFCN